MDATSLSMAAMDRPPASSHDAAHAAAQHGMHGLASHPAPSAEPPTRVPAWRSIAWLVLALALVLALGSWLVHNAAANLAARHIASGFGFLNDSAGFAISEGVVPYDSGDRYALAFAAGIANTLRAALPAVLLASVLGFAAGIAQISRHALLRLLAVGYVDIVRNVPLLVQVLLWYFALTSLLPDAERPLQWDHLVFLSKGGLTVTLPWQPAEVGAFGVNGGATMSPEWLALVSALTLYAGAYCAEVVRAGLQAVPRAQWEAAHALGLTRGQALRRVIVPQALRVIVPPYTSLVMNTIKNSSLAVAIGYPDIVSVATTSLNQNGQAIECIAIIAGVYLLLNLATAAVMGVVNTRVQLKER
ncbi:MAG TPA: ABC transporter permease subunit [Albitalea sp.]|nr:ABC transporter permease subunit [Albitalea sp.]